MTLPDQVDHFTIEKGEEERSNVGSIHISVRHNNDPAITDLGHVEPVFFGRFVTYATANSCDDVADRFI